jgi:hypothetical protein
VTIEFHCPHCDKLLKTPDDKAGVRANCPGCGQVVTVPETAQADASFAAVDDLPSATGTVPDAADAARDEIADSAIADDTKLCPMCGKTIKKAATRCRFCGETLQRTGASEPVPTRIDAGEILSHTWEIFKTQGGLVFGAVMVVWLITVAAAVAGSVFQNVLLVVAGGAPGRGGNPLAMGAGIIGLILIFQVLNIALAAYLQGGLHVLLLRVARGDNVDFADLFSGSNFFWRFFWGTLLFQIVLVVAYLFLIVPGIVLSLMFWPVYYVIVDRDLGVFESLRLAHELTTGNFMAVFVLFLAGVGVCILGFFALCLGLLVAAPFVELLWAVAYCGMNGQLSSRPR